MIKLIIIFLTSSAKFDEAMKARALFAIVFIFVLCNLPRIILNLEEGISAAISYHDSYYAISNQDLQPEINTGATSIALNATVSTSSKRCYLPAFWSYILNHINNFLLTLNASVCSIIYCLICRRFRTELRYQFHNLCHITFATIFHRTNTATPPQSDV